MWAHKFWSSLDNRASPGKEMKGKRGETGKGEGKQEREVEVGMKGKGKQVPEEQQREDLR